MEHGSYCCSRPNCEFVIHVKCAISWENKFWYDITELENPDEFKELDESGNLIFRVLRETKVGDNVVAAEIIHSSHDQHSLTFNDEINDNKHLVSPTKPLTALSSAFDVQQLLTILRIKQRNHITSFMMRKM
ncbi:hypothetical protein Gotri_020538 [Gossypium trilobum]|uniref:Uncharacterized protein n=1 Tax=Gossypium trilobum TaxID=34281 RepID=A0A7J9DA07_9ROSI|nr:hypothetical protein [Gossypium trilobum]